MARSYTPCQHCGQDPRQGKHGNTIIPVGADRLCPVRGCGETPAFFCRQGDGSKSVVCPNEHPPQHFS